MERTEQSSAVDGSGVSSTQQSSELASSSNDSHDGKRSLRSTLWILVAIAIGIIVGLLVGPKAAPLGDLGKLFVSLIKAFAIPLLFFAILEAVATTQIAIKSAGKLLLIVAINAILAAFIGMGLASVFQPGKHISFNVEDAGSASLLKQAEGKSIDAMAFIDNILPDSLLEPFNTNNVLSLVFVAVLLGAAWRSFPDEENPWKAALSPWLTAGLRISERLMIWLVKLTPLAVFGVIAKVVGENGFKTFQGLLAYLGVGALGLALQVLVVYHLWIAVVCRRSILQFWKEAGNAVLFSFGVNSSLATLPLTLKALDRLGVSKESSRLSACIGTNLNNDGILLYEAMAVLFVAQTMGMQLSIGAQITVAALCMITAVGIAGVPEAGIISLAIILSNLGISAEILPILLTVDWILARLRSVTNVSADVTTAMILDRFAGNKKPSAVTSG